MRKPSDATQLRSVKSELKRLREKYIRVCGEVQTRRFYGAQMANACYNLSQDSGPGSKLDKATRDLLGNLRQTWDRIPQGN